MKILITGGAGFGGSGLVKELLKRRHWVTVLDLIAPNHAENLNEVMDHPKFKYIWKATFDIQPEDVKGYEIICAFNALRARKIIEGIFMKTSMRPRLWENYRGLWYLKFGKEELNDVRTPS